MKKIIFRIVTAFQHFFLKRKGYRLGDNVVVSVWGVRKIGSGKIICGDNVNINSETMFIAVSDITIGKNSTIAYRSLLTTSANPNAPYNKLCRIYEPKQDPIVIGEDCWIGAGAIILPGVHIGDGSVVAAGAVVNRDVPDHVMVAGCPAVVKKNLTIPNDGD